MCHVHVASSEYKHFAFNKKLLRSTTISNNFAIGPTHGYFRTYIVSSAHKLALYNHYFYGPHIEIGVLYPTYIKEMS